MDKQTIAVVLLIVAIIFSILTISSISKLNVGNFESRVTVPDINTKFDVGEDSNGRVGFVLVPRSGGGG